MPPDTSGPLRETLTIAERRAIAREHHPEPPPSAVPRHCLGCLATLANGRPVCSDACDDLAWTSCRPCPASCGRGAANPRWAALLRSPRSTRRTRRRPLSRLLSEPPQLGFRYDGDSFPERYRGGAFIRQRGWWNRSEFSGYRVVFVPFDGGQPSGAAEDFLTGFMADPQKGEAYGRPVGLALLPDGSLLVADNAGGTVWRVQALD